MSKSKSSSSWLLRQRNDQYTQLAKSEGYRSRAVYKLLEINAKEKILKPGVSVVDLGAAPGGWAQAAANLIKSSGLIIALDILPMEAIPGVTCIQGDFTQTQALDDLINVLGGNQVDLVMSDMAPNMSGNRHVDQPKSMYLAELAKDFAKLYLKPGGNFLVKVFQGSDFNEYYTELKSQYQRVLSIKPKSSRKESKEIYLLAKIKK